MSVVKRICQHIFDLVFFEGQAAAGFYAVVGKIVGNLLQPFVAFAVQLKSRYNQRRTPFIYNNSAGTHIIYVAERCKSRHFTASDFLA
ncbi:hypothetical protein IPO96_04075 [Candidatus Saccharibacteria bacterium]|nr:MAG: hypothetical protein IPO96_04075 [Candidatus Saccharibacteria bacterium]